MTPAQSATQLLVHFNESDGQFADASLARRKLSLLQGFAAGAPSKFGANALSKTVVGGSNDRAAFGPPIAVAGAQYTIEFQIRPTQRTANTSPIVWNGYFSYARPGVAVSPDGEVVVAATDIGNNTVFFNCGSVLPLNTYTHVVVSFDGTTTRVFYNGNLVNGTTSLPVMSLSPTGEINVGGDNSGYGSSFIGQIDEVRFLVGLPLYTTNFTPPAAPYDDISFSLLTANSINQPTRIFSNPPPATNFKYQDGAVFLLDAVDGGRGLITGTVKEKSAPDNLPLARKVRLFDEFAGRFVRETWSEASTGNYVFANIDPTRRYTVIAYDYLHNYRAVVADNIIPETMP